MISLPSNTKFKVKIKTANFKIEFKDATREQAEKIVDGIVALFVEDKFVQESYDSIKGNNFGFCSISNSGNEFSVSAYLPEHVVNKEKTISCGSRISQGRATAGVNEDCWEQRGPNKCCSYCGSASFEDFMSIADKVIAGEKDYGIEKTDKGYKFYIQQPQVPNAGFGAIKFYTWHAPEGLSKEELKLINEKLHKAITITHEKFMKRLTKTINNET